MATTVKIKKDDWGTSVAYWHTSNSEVYICATRSVRDWIVTGYADSVSLPCIHLTSARDVRDYAHTILGIAEMRKGV